MLNNAEYLYPGIVVYRDVFKKEMDIINRLENNLINSDVENRWSVAITGYSIKDKNYRDCFDYKIKKIEEDDSNKSKNRIELENLWQECKDAQTGPIEDYRSMFGVAPLNYWEASNFIKYGKDQHFQVHSDHGYSYIAVLSAVGYINDDYEGGELYFDKFNLTIKPKAGDLYLFPSAFVYSHAAMPVQSGTKYSIVTMLDYFEAAHTPEYREIEKRYAESYSLK
jgi:2OG-Fe(II) oxygenase superfamily